MKLQNIFILLITSIGIAACQTEETVTLTRPELKLTVGKKDLKSFATSSISGFDPIASTFIFSGDTQRLSRELVSAVAITKCGQWSRERQVQPAVEYMAVDILPLPFWTQVSKSKETGCELKLDLQFRTYSPQTLNYQINLDSSEAMKMATVEQNFTVMLYELEDFLKNELSLDYVRIDAICDRSYKLFEKQDSQSAELVQLEVLDWLKEAMRSADKLKCHVRGAKFKETSSGSQLNFVIIKSPQISVEPNTKPAANLGGYVVGLRVRNQGSARLDFIHKKAGQTVYGQTYDEGRNLVEGFNISPLRISLNELQSPLDNYEFSLDSGQVLHVFANAGLEWGHGRKRFKHLGLNVDVTDFLYLRVSEPGYPTRVVQLSPGLPVEQIFSIW